MMISKKMLYVAMLALGGIISPLHAKKHDSKHDHKDSDRFVGVYAINESDGSFGTFTLHRDGTAIFHDSLSNSQAIPGFPAGVYLTIGQGIWKQIDKNRVKLVLTAVINLKDTFTRNECGDLLFAGIPFSRGKFEGEIEFSDCGKELSFAGTNFFFEIDDTTFCNPLIINGQPFPPQPITATGNRVTFKTCPVA